MKDWLIGTALVLIIPIVTAASWFLISLIAGPNIIGALLAMVSGGLAFRWVLRRANKHQWDKALGRK